MLINSFDAFDALAASKPDLDFYRPRVQAGRRAEIRGEGRFVEQGLGQAAKPSIFPNRDQEPNRVLRRAVRG